MPAKNPAVRALLVCPGNNVLKTEVHHGKLFHLKENHTDVKTEVMAGITTFMTMAYILAVNPNILSAAGMDAKAVLIATSLAAFVGTMLMAFLANYPFALAPGMGLNAYFAYTVVLSMGYSWQMALLAVFVAFIGATVISSQLARPMSRLIQPALERSITQVLEEQTHAVFPPPETSEASQPPALSDAFSGEEGQEGEEDWLAQLPLDEVLDALQASSLYQHFIQPIQDAIQDGVMEVTTSAARAVADYLALELTRMFLFLVSFALVLLLWLLLSRVLDLACKLPVLSTLNHWSGAASGW